jgi:hypothetical protein
MRLPEEGEAMVEKQLILSDVTDVAGAVERLAGASTDQLRAVLGRLQDAEKATLALLRQRTLRERRAAVRHGR